MKELFLAAIELGADDRRAFVDAIADEAIRAEVRSLLAAREESEGFLDGVSAIDAVGSADRNPDRLAGQMIGRYRIIREIGRGGMGAVYLAERDEFRQKVAVKLIKNGADSEAVLRRFIVERQILASLEDPNIARLLDGGTTEDGAPYFVMEYVEGLPIDEFCARNELSIRESLLLFRKICAAVSHAHRNLVIHRDLKSSNILVTREGEPKLLDFGIAKLFSPENSGHDETTHFRALTPEYASPEQLRGDKLTTATDVYSLGVILYQILTGTRPFETSGKTFGEVMKIVCEKEATRPSAAVSWRRSGQIGDPGAGLPVPRSAIRDPQRLRGDLDNIVLKALRKEPERRYSSVEQFSEDIRRHLEGLPVSARAGTLAYRAEKFVRRNRLAALISLLLIMALAGGVAATLWQAGRADRERLRAERRFGEVRELANSLITEFPAEIDQSATKAKELLVRRSLRYLDGLAGEAGEDEGLQRELATAYEKIGDVQGNEYYSNLGDTDGALRSYRKSLDLRLAALSRRPADQGLRDEAARSYERLGDVAWSLDDLPAAVEAYRQAVSIREALAGEMPDSPGAASALAMIYWKMGDLLGNDGFANLGDTTGALDHHRRALAIRERLAAQDPSTEKKDDLLASYTNMSNVLRLSGDSAGAEQGYRHALTLAREILDSNPTNLNYMSGVALTYLYLGTMLADNGKYDEAIGSFEESIGTEIRIIAGDPEDVQAKRNLAVVKRRLGTAYLLKGDPLKALGVYREALAISESQAASDPKNSTVRGSLSLNYMKIGDALTAAGRTAEALRNYHTALEIRQAISDENPTDIKSRVELASIYAGIGDALLSSDPRESVANYEKALDIRRRLSQDDPRNVPARRDLASILTMDAAGHERLARSGRVPAGERQSEHERSAALYREGLLIWNELRQAGKLSRPDEEKAARTEREASPVLSGERQTK